MAGSRKRHPHRRQPRRQLPAPQQRPARDLSPRRNGKRSERRNASARMVPSVGSSEPTANKLPRVDRAATSTPPGSEQTVASSKKTLLAKWWFGVIGIASIIYFGYQTLNTGHLDLIGLVLTVAALSAGAWFAIGWVARLLVILIWLNYLVLFFGVIFSVILFSMDYSIPVDFTSISIPAASPYGACTMSAATWALHGFSPGQCDGIALARLGSGIICLIVAGIMWDMRRFMKMWTVFTAATGAELTTMRAESQAWETARRKDWKETVGIGKEEIADLKAEMKSLPKDSQEYEDRKKMVRQLHAGIFRGDLHLSSAIHAHRKTCRRERALLRKNWIEQLQSSEIKWPTSFWIWIFIRPYKRDPPTLTNNVP
jgi:hypothetical protein